MSSVLLRSNPEEGEEEDYEEVDESVYKSQRDAVLFVIEVSDSMLTADESGAAVNSKTAPDSPTLAALKCAYQLMQQRIISNPTDMMGVLLFGTEKSKFFAEGSSDTFVYPNCYLLTDLGIPSAQDVRALRQIVENETDGEDGNTDRILTPSTTRPSMANVLFCANHLFTAKAPNFRSRRLFLVTDNDDPHAGDKALCSAAAVRARDLFDLGVALELFPILHQGHVFERSKFYDDIVYRATAIEPDGLSTDIHVTSPISSGDGITLLQSLLSSINSKATPRRALFTLPLEVAPGLKIGVKGYTMVKQQVPVRSCYVWMNGDTPVITAASTTLIAEDTAREIDKSKARKAFM